MNGYELEGCLTAILGETQEEKYNEWWEKYTGLNAFFHRLSGETGYDTDTDSIDDKIIIRDNGIEVKGLGLFQKVELYDANFDTYEQRCDTFLVFDFNGECYRVNGSFDSHRGGVWEPGIDKVNPVAKTIQVWETV